MRWIIIVAVVAPIILLGPSKDVKAQSPNDARPLSLSPFAEQEQTLVPRGSEKPSFDCAQAKTAAARLICADAELAQLDGQLGITFQKRKSQISAPDQSKFVAEELAWLRERNTRCKLVEKNSAEIEALASSKPCMVDAITKRIAALAQIDITAARPFPTNTGAPDELKNAAASTIIESSNKSEVTETHREPNANALPPLTRSELSITDVAALIIIGIAGIGSFAFYTVRSLWACRTRQENLISETSTTVEKSASLDTSLDWFYAINDGHIGPITVYAIRDLLLRGAISRDTLVWHETFGQSWKPIRDTNIASVTRRTPPLVRSKN
jgi:uncharacterized protein YecT (DUF1311 family)